MIYFIGAGPGDAELITLKAVNIIKRCQIVIYAGSLVNKEILKYADNKANIYNSAIMNLEEIINIMQESNEKGLNVARLHTGDPSIYSAINEQMIELKKRNIEFEVIPGVSSFSAAAASLKKELTIPEITQTVILTRLSGKTTVPEREKLSDLAKHKATMAIFLSIQEINKVVNELKKGYENQTPVAVIYKASWDDQVIIEGTLENIVKKVEDKKITKTAMILVGDFLKEINVYSKLYSKEFYHEFREKDKI
ncbi:MAG: precorrin-4 C(11)-methyltransferase [Thermoanaerobacteraceae bacterium]